MNKVLAVVAFLVLMFIGTYFARVSGGGIGVKILGYCIGGAAFAVAPVIWTKKWKD